MVRAFDALLCISLKEPSSKNDLKFINKSDQANRVIINLISCAMEVEEIDEEYQMTFLSISKKANGSDEH